MPAERLHRVDAVVEVSGSGWWLDVHVTCPWAPHNPGRDCRIEGLHEEDEDGCVVLQWLDAMGVEGVRMDVPGAVRTPFLVRVTADEDGPVLHWVGPVPADAGPDG